MTNVSKTAKRGAPRRSSPQKVKGGQESPPHTSIAELPSARTGEGARPHMAYANPGCHSGGEGEILGLRFATGMYPTFREARNVGHPGFNYGSAPSARS